MGYVAVDQMLTAFFVLQVPIKEDVEWLPTCTKHVPELSELKDWMQVGKKKLTLDDESDFCDPQVLADVLKCKVSKIIWV